MVYPKKQLFPTGLWFFVIIALWMSGCSLISNQRILTLDEQLVNDILKNAKTGAETGAPGLQVTGVDMREGYIHVFVKLTKEDGSSLDGSYNVSLAVVDGIIQAEVSAIDLPGLEPDQQLVDQIAKKIGNDFTAATSQTGSRIEILSITTTENGVQMLVRM